MLLRSERHLCIYSEHSITPWFGLFVVTGTALSVISCISFVDSSPNLFFLIYVFVDEAWLPTKKLTFLYVIAWARGQLRINFTSIFKVFTKLPEYRSDESNLENFENTSEINP